MWYQYSLITNVKQIFYGESKSRYPLLQYYKSQTYQKYFMEFCLFAFKNLIISFCYFDICNSCICRSDQVVLSEFQARMPHFGFTGMPALDDKASFVLDEKASLYSMKKSHL